MSEAHAQVIGLPQAMANAVEQDEVVAAPGTASIDEIRARLAARGLVKTKPAILLPKEPRPAAADAVPTPVVREEKQHWAESELDAWDVAPGKEEVTTQCPQCRAVYFLPLESTRFMCSTCDRAWRWAICAGCDSLCRAVERQEAWRCKCSHVNRSWWRTDTARRAAIDVVARRRHDVVQEQRRAVRAGIKRRRRKLVAFAISAAVLTTGTVIGVRMAEPSAASGAGAACAHFDRLRADISNGTIDRPALKESLRELQRKSEGVDGALQGAVVDLQAAPPGSAGFLTARTAVADTCDRLGH